MHFCAEFISEPCFIFILFLFRIAKKIQEDLEKVSERETHAHTQKVYSFTSLEKFLYTIFSLFPDRNIPSSHYTISFTLHTSLTTRDCHGLSC